MQKLKTFFLSFQIWFLSRSSNGMLLYNGGQSSGSGDFISVNIVNGFLVLSYDLGSGVARISSLRSVLIQFLIPLVPAEQGQEH